MTFYATLADARIENKATADTDDAVIRRYIGEISRRIDNHFRRDPTRPARPVFQPYIETRTYRLNAKSVDSRYNTYRVPASLLAVTGVTAGEESLVVGTDIEAYPDSVVPIGYLRFIDACCRSWYQWDCTDCGSPPLVTITGTWGIHRDYPNAWWAADALAANITAAVTTLTVADVDGTDLYGFTPRISAGNLLKIGDEFLEVTATDTATNIVTVRRGVNGSTAAAHTAADTVYVWQTEDPIRREVARQAAFMVARRGSYSTTEVTPAGVEIRYPRDLLDSLRAVLAEYVYDA